MKDMPGTTAPRLSGARNKSHLHQGMSTIEIGVFTFADLSGLVTPEERL